MSDELMVDINGVRVRKDEEAEYRARHKAVLEPHTMSTAEKKTVRHKKPAKSDDE